MDHFELPKRIERYLATISRLYAQDGNRSLQELIVNARARVNEGWSRQDWNGGTYGHLLYLQIPEELFLAHAKQRVLIQNQIRDDLNSIHSFMNEFIEEVFLEMEESEDREWRKESGLLIAGKRVVSAAAIERIWETNEYRVFLSHRTDVKQETADLKEQLRLFGISCFVAHQDIHPTKAWQDEIENALGSMDAFVALMTPNFHESEWTDQEVGFAVGRGVPIIPVKLGKDPYGFIGKFQALSSTWVTAAVDIARVLINKDGMLNSYIQALRNCPNWSSGNTLAEVLPAIEKLTIQQIDEFVKTYNQTPELRGSFGFRGSRPGSFGPGIVAYLRKFDNSRNYKYSADGLIEVEASYS